MTWRISMAAPVSALWLSSAAVLEPLLSIVIFSGVPFLLTALRKNLRAALQSRLAVNSKSTVAPALSTARYRYFQLPLEFLRHRAGETDDASDMVGLSSLPQHGGAWVAFRRDVGDPLEIRTRQ